MSRPVDFQSFRRLYYPGTSDYGAGGAERVLTHNDFSTVPVNPEQWLLADKVKVVVVGIFLAVGIYLCSDISTLGYGFYTFCVGRVVAAINFRNFFPNNY